MDIGLRKRIQGLVEVVDFAGNVVGCGVESIKDGKLGFFPKIIEYERK